MKFHVGCLQGSMKEGKVEWEYGTYAFGRFDTAERAVERGIALIEYILNHHGDLRKAFWMVREGS